MSMLKTENGVITTGTNMQDSINILQGRLRWMMSDRVRRALSMVALESIDAFAELIRTSEESRARRRIDYKRGLKEARSIVDHQMYMQGQFEQRFGRGQLVNEYGAKRQELREVINLLDKEINK